MIKQLEEVKKTEIGVIPKDWGTASLSEIALLMTNGFVGTSTVHYVENGVPYLMANNVRENRIDDSSLTYITEEFHLANERSKLREGDLLTVQTGFIGVSCLVPKEYEGANTHALIITRLDNKKTDSRFICQFINSALGQKGIKQIQTVGGRPHLNTGDFKHYVVPLPTLPEQRRIADILSTWDTAIEQTKKLIDAKGKRKHGLMQQLLTGKKRFQEFEGQDWQRVRIADLFEEVWRYEKWDENALYNLVSIRRRGGGLFSRGALLGQQIKVKKLKSLRTGDFLISKRQVVHGAWGLVSSEYNGTMVSDEYDSLVVKNPNQLSVEFFTHLSRLPLIRRMAALACNGVHIEKLIFDWDDFSKNLISIPSSMEEQRRISAVLDSCNKEIELLQQQLDALKRQKRGLMQKLLTGQIRVKVDDLEAAVVEAG